MTAVAKGETLQFSGGDYLRQKLILSVLSGRPIRLKEIRVEETIPGLKNYEINFIRLMDKVTNGTVIEISPTGTNLYFQPGLLFGGDIEHTCSDERGIGYYLEALLMIGVFCKHPLNAVLKGVTNNNVDPSPDLIKSSMFPVLHHFLVDFEGLELKIIKRGLLPLGGGEVSFKCPVLRETKTAHLVNWGVVKRIRGTAYAVRVSPAATNRLIEAAKGIMLNFTPDVSIVTDVRKAHQGGRSPGFGIHLTAETTKGVIYSSEGSAWSVLGAHDGERCPAPQPERVGREAAQRLLYEVFCGGVVDSTAQALAMLFMALGPKDSSMIITGQLSEYAVAFLRHLDRFLDVSMVLEALNAEDVNLSSGSDRVVVSCFGIGYTNVSKRTL
ncbi:hypothetical protein NQ318_022646 [Aromia moschata]|uniref:RNA 3'-terminal phosphate cyclase-like protein n=1 Tax=Aromia moschata TaxID=1265417 RepID=A0AAV8YN77_9CUCU|nr:hypothetical protein NQ318_022646 [Aromia moschata]